MLDALKNGLRLGNKVAIVTGGGSGYGEGIAKGFAAQGAKVVVADINEAGGRRVAQSMPDNISFVRTDVTRKEDCTMLLDTTQNRYGQIDCLVNNAGTSYKNKPTMEVTEVDFDRCFNVNVKSIFHATAALVPRLIEQKRPEVMMNIASVGATRPRPGLTWYNASKGAIWNVTKGLAAEYGPHQIRVNSICPLLGGTGLFEALSGVPDTAENRAKFIDNVPLKRLCEPEDVAGVCIFLASDEAQFVTGVNMEVYGGRAV